MHEAPLTRSQLISFMYRLLRVLANSRLMSLSSEGAVTTGGLGLTEARESAVSRACGLVPRALFPFAHAAQQSRCPER